MLQMVPEKASSASILLRNAADSAGEGIICVNFAQKRCRWCLKKHHLRHFRPEMQQIVPGRVPSASISLRNAADGAWKSIICGTIPPECSRWCLEECETQLDKWCFTLKHISSLDRLRSGSDRISGSGTAKVRRKNQNILRG